MARPRKKGSYYFPLDVDILEDKKIRMLLNRFGSDGFYFYIYLLCNIYREGYFLIWEKEWEEVALMELSMSREKVGQMRNYLLERSLFSKTLFQSVKALTSRAIQARYQEIVRARASKNPISVDGRLWLLSPEETADHMLVSGWENAPQSTRFSENNHTNKKKENNKKKEKAAAGQRVFTLYQQRGDEAYEAMGAAAIQKIAQNAPPKAPLDKKDDLADGMDPGKERL